jgi:hypothetical protein
MMSENLEEFRIYLSDSLRNTADLGVQYIANNQDRFDRMVQIAINEPYPLGMRAARIISLCVDQNSQLFLKHAEIIIPKLANFSIDGVKRGFLRIYCKEIELEKLENLGLLLDSCFKILMSATESIANKYYSFEIIMKIAKSEPDLLIELRPIVEDEYFTNSISFKKRVKKILLDFTRRLEKHQSETQKKIVRQKKQLF